jgi:hypothetical protein
VLSGRVKQQICGLGGGTVSFSRISLIFVGLMTSVGREDTSVNAVPVFCLSRYSQ